jgi:hypothetical protein
VKDIKLNNLKRNETSWKVHELSFGNENHQWTLYWQPKPGILSTRPDCYQTISSYSEADAFCSHKIILTECNNRVCWDQKYTRLIKKKNAFPESLWMHTAIILQTVQRSTIIKPLTTPLTTRFPDRTSHHVKRLLVVTVHIPQQYTMTMKTDLLRNRKPVLFTNKYYQCTQQNKQ